MKLTVASETGRSVTDSGLACVIIVASNMVTIAVKITIGSTLRQYLLYNIPIEIIPIYNKIDPDNDRAIQDCPVNLPVETGPSDIKAASDAKISIRM